MKKLTREEFIDLLREKHVAALLQDGSHIDIARGDAVAWFDYADKILNPSFVLNTKDHIWLGVLKEDYREEYLLQVGGPN